MKTNFSKACYFLAATFLLFTSDVTIANAKPVLRGNAPFAKIVPAPVKTFYASLIYFNLKPDTKSYVRMDWATSSEINSDYFIIEKSFDGKNFTKIAEISSKGNSKEVTQYSCTDPSAIKTVIYYRLTEIDKEGNQTILDLKSINLKVRN